MRRTPLGGLFLSACLGVSVAEPGLILPFFWAIAFVFGSVAALFRQLTVLTLITVFFFFGFWQSFRRTTDPGYQLGGSPRLINQLHQFLLEADTDSRPFRWGNRLRQRFFARITAMDGHTIRFRVEAELPSKSIYYGDQLGVRGRLALAERALNPGEFDNRTYLQHLGVYLTLTCTSPSEVAIVNHGWGNPIQAIALRCRKAIEAIPTHSLENDRPIKALIDGITFGDRSEFDPDLLDLLQDTGTLHLFVVDGLKVTLLAGVSWIVARLLCLPRRWTAALVLPFLVLYCAATGLSSAGLRATLMALFVLLGVSLDRPVVQLNALAGSGLILLIWNPEELFQLGFQLSFTIVALIVILAHPLTSCLAFPFRFDPWIPAQLISPARRAYHRVAARSAELFAVCLICWAASLPFSLFYFHRISLNNVIANFLAVPIGTWILFTALASILIYPISSWASICLNNSNWLLGHLFLAVVNGVAAIPGQTMNVSLAPWSSNVKVVLLASGRSETVYFHAGAVNGLLNPGSPSKYRRITEPFLRSQGVNELHFLSWSKPDGDHSGSATEVLRHFPIRMDVSTCQRSDHHLLTRPSAGEQNLTASESIRINRQNISATFMLARADSWPPIFGCEIGPFQFLFLGGNHQQDARQPSQTVDVIFASSPRQISSAELVRRFHPRAILYGQGKSGDEEALAGRITPIWFLAEKGAVTLTLCKQSLELCSYLGDRLTLPSRSR
jgi:ComEC/Rec2-related protein